MSESELGRRRSESLIHNRQWPLFAITVLFLLESPLAPGDYGKGASFVAVALVTLLFGAGAYCVARSRWMFVACLVMGLATALGQGVIQLGGQRVLPIVVAFHVTAIAFVGIVGLHVLRSLMRTSRVTGDTILGGVTAYLLLGILFAYAYSLVATTSPGAFQVPETIVEAGGSMTWLPVHGTTEEVARHGGNLHVIYFSFTTLTTLGYGDIAPRSGLACLLTSVEAVFGQLYLAILIARLVAVAKIGKGD